MRFVWIAIMIFATGCGDGVPGQARQGSQAQLGGTWTWTLDRLICATAGLLTPAGEQFVVTQDGDRLTASFTDANGNMVDLVATVDGTDVMGTLTITPPAPAAGRKLYSATEGRVAVIDLNTHTFAYSLPLQGVRPVGIHVSPDRDFVFAETQGGITVIETTGDTVDTFLADGRHCTVAGGKFYSTSVDVNDTDVVIRSYPGLAQLGEIQTLLARIHLLRPGPPLDGSPAASLFVFGSTGEARLSMFDTNDDSLVVQSASVVAAEAIVAPANDELFVFGIVSGLQPVPEIVAVHDLVDLPTNPFLDPGFNAYGAVQDAAVNPLDGLICCLAVDANFTRTELVRYDAAARQIVGAPFPIQVAGADRLATGIEICPDGTAYIGVDGTLKRYDLTTDPPTDLGEIPVAGALPGAHHLARVDRPVAPGVIVIDFTGTATFDANANTVDGQVDIAGTHDQCDATGVGFQVQVPPP